MPRRGKATTGTSAVASSGTASVIHQITMSAVTAATVWTGLEMPGGSRTRMRNAPIPKRIPIYRLTPVPESRRIIRSPHPQRRWSPWPYPVTLNACGPTNG